VNQPPREPRINEGGPPSTFRWNEFEARLDKGVVRFGGVNPREGRRMRPLPEVTREQAEASGVQLLRALQRLVREVSERGLLTDLVVANAWLHGVQAIENASKVCVETELKNEEQ
jgi:hypothetical protein